MPTASHPLLENPQHTIEKRSKVVSAAEAVRLVRDGDTVATGGFVGIGLRQRGAAQVRQRIRRKVAVDDLKAAHIALPTGDDRRAQFAAGGMGAEDAGIEMQEFHGRPRWSVAAVAALGRILLRCIFGIN